LKIRVNAKVNINLKITGTLGSLHTLDSEMVSVDLCDALEVTEAKETSLDMNIELSGINTITKAIDCFQKVFGGINVHVKVDKKIPMGAGLGGSSADAAGVLYALGKLNGVDIDNIIHSGVAAGVGSDVPFMLMGGRAKVHGTGENVLPLQYKEYIMLIVKPYGSVSTREAYALYDAIGSYSEDRNDLQKAACELNNNITETIKELKRLGGREAAVTGSGSACFALYDTIEEAGNAKKACKVDCEYIGVHRSEQKGIIEIE